MYGSPEYTCALISVQTSEWKFRYNSRVSYWEMQSPQADVQILIATIRKLYVIPYSFYKAPLAG